MYIKKDKKHYFCRYKNTLFVYLSIVTLNMDELFALQEDVLQQVSLKERYLLADIDWKNRLIGLKGARGSGKTTLLLQRIRFKLSEKAIALYVSLDNLYFSEHTLVGSGQRICFRRWHPSFFG